MVPSVLKKQNDFVNASEQIRFCYRQLLPACCGISDGQAEF